MKKSHKHTELSDKKCKCGKPIKARLVAIKKKIPSLCYQCHCKTETVKGHAMQDAFPLAKQMPRLKFRSAMASGVNYEL